MKVLITGGAGLVGAELARSAPESVQVVVTRFRRPVPSAVAGRVIAIRMVNLAQPLAFFEVAEQIRPDLVIHTAYSKTDHQVTVDSTTEVATACAALDVPLIHFSTDALFDGDNAPYDETAQPSPIHAYGRAKSLAEAAVTSALPEATTIRTSLVLASDGSDGTSRWAIDQLRAGERVTFFNDEFRCPIMVDDLARLTWEVAMLPLQQRQGVWHLVGPERMSRVDVGAILCERFALDASLVDSQSAASMGEPRPRDLSLSSVRVGSLTHSARPVGSVNPHG